MTDPTPHLPLVRTLALKLSRGLPRTVDVDDLVQEGSIGLMRAAERYDPGRGCKFETFAERLIMGAMREYLRTIDWVPKLVRTRSKRGELKRDAHYKATGERQEQARRGFNRPHSESDPGDYSEPVKMVAAPEIYKTYRLPDLVESADEFRHLTQGFSRQQRAVTALCLRDGLDWRTVSLTLGVSETRVGQVRRQVLDILRSRLDRARLSA